MNQKPKSGPYKETGTRRKMVRMFGIQLNYRIEEEVTWEVETYLGRKLSRLPLNQFTYLIFQSFSILESRDEILFRGEGCDNLGFMG